MLIERQKSCLLIIDVQEKLTPFIHEHKKLIDGCTWLIRLAQRLEIPVLTSEQYPKGLGPTVPAIKTAFLDYSPMTKTEFSCAANAGCLEKIHHKHIIIAGIEAHVCVLQTAIEFVQQKKTVFVVADAIASREESDKLLALKRMRALGVQIVSREMVLFEWLRRSDIPEFKSISQEFLQS